MRIVLLVGVVCLGCTTASLVSDSGAVGPRYDRWETMIARPRSAVFDVALRVLTDSGYVMAQANRDLGVISTADRKAISVKRGSQQLGTMLGSDYPVRLSVVITPQGLDSTRLSITGQYRLNNINETATVNARSGEWRFVRGIGEAILAHLAQ